MDFNREVSLALFYFILSLLDRSLQLCYNTSWIHLSRQLNKPDTDCCEPNKLQQFFSPFLMKIMPTRQKWGEQNGKPNTPQWISLKRWWTVHSGWKIPPFRNEKQICFSWQISQALLTGKSSLRLPLQISFFSLTAYKIISAISSLHTGYCPIAYTKLTVRLLHQLIVSR